MSYHECLVLLNCKWHVITKQASVQRCNATVIFDPDEKISYPVIVNDEHLHEDFLNVAGQVVGAKNVKEMQPSMGTDDFAFYQEAFPGLFFSVGMNDEKKGVFEFVHSPNLRVNEDVHTYGAALMHHWL